MNDDSRRNDAAAPAPADARQRVVGEQPDALELLQVARDTLLESVLPELSGDSRYHALMIANAMAIALRELGQAPTDLDAELNGLRGLYEHEASPAAAADGESAVETLRRLERQLVRDLRDGVLDGGPQYAVRRWLDARIRSRVAVSNPKRLAKVEPGVDGESGRGRA